jgi:hypothetical protein
LFDVTFHVTDGTNNLAGASVTVGTETKMTDENGLTVFARPNGDFSYSVSKYGFSPETGAFTVASASQTIDVILTMLPHYDVTFHVTSGVNNIEGASIAITGVGTILTNMDGNAVFSMIDGVYNYTITKTGYEVKTGTTTVAGSQYTIEETLVPIFAVTIHVTTGGNNLEGATVTVGTQSVNTNANGNAVFNRADGTYAYTVTKPGYNAESGDFTVSGGPLTVEVVMTPVLYEVTFHTTAVGNNLEGVLISIDNGASGTTDVDGIAIIELPDGDFVYTASKDGYGTIQDLVVVSGGPVSVEIVMIPDPTYAVTFHVTTVGGANLEGAEVTVGSEMVLTNASGLAIFDLENGNYSYTVTKLGYVNQSGNFLVVNEPKTVNVVMPQFEWATTFHVTSGGADLVGATVTVNPGNLTAFTGTTGNAVINIVNGTYNFTVEKAGYVTTGDDFVVNNATQTIEVEMDLFPWQVTFHIVSVGGALADVAVTCNGETVMTDASGNAVFNLPNETYDYECTKDGYLTLTGSITVNGANLIKNLIMFPDSWPVTFNVTSSGAPVEGATVTLDGLAPQITPANGIVVFQIANGTYDWTVEHPDFETQTGSVTINNAAKTVNVVLFTGIGNISASSFSVYPNPSNGIFNLTTTATIGSESDIAVYSTEGKLVYSGKLEGNEVEVIELLNQDKGMYILRILVDDKVFNKTLINK